MKKKHLFYFIMLVFILASCGSSNSEESEVEYAIEGQTADGFVDGTYCADVTYYNPNTGTSNDYTLEVEVSGNEVIQINFGNGGWLDSDHMSPETLDENGECTIISDKNYEYSIKITGRDCGYSDNINPETDEDMPRYKFSECTEILDMSEEEIEDCLSNYDEDELLSENGFKILEKYVNNIRSIHANYNREVAKLQGKQNKLQNEINEGYVQNIERRSAYGVTSQVVTIKKRGVNYVFQVRGSEKCTMGTATFDENATGWQMVYIKQYPDVEHWSGYSMRIIN